MSERSGGLFFKILCVFLLSCVFLSSCKKSVPEQQESTTVEQKSEAVDAAAEEKAGKDGAGTEDVKLVPLELKLPNKRFVGTPQDTRVPNMEEVRTGPRPMFYVPEGTVNLAAGKEVSGSDEEPIIGEFEMVTDSDKEASDGSYVELGPELQYVTIDLGEKSEIFAIVVWHYHMQPCVYFDVVVQVADDADFISNITTVFNNDIDNSAGLGVGTDKHYTETNEGKLIDAKGVVGRYVRLYSNGSSSNELNHYTEVEVYGKPIK